ncbi:MAG: pur operon repressor [Bacillota bacterium]|nr:pur operon repressor [Bacillota bacterium]
MKRTERVGAILNVLSQNPNRIYPLSYFCALFQAAKSTVSEDVSIARELLQTMGSGRIDTITGARGGIRFLPTVSSQDAEKLLDELCRKLSDGNRILGGGFLYTSDLMFDADLTRRIGQLFACRFMDAGADYVVTVETKGIPVALMTAHMLNLPLVVIRREAKVSEGSTVSINYFSGSSDRIEKMSLSKRALAPGSSAIVIDDFMRAGGSLRGIQDMLAEFDVSIAGMGVVIASAQPEKKKVQGYFPLLYLEKVDEEEKLIEVCRNEEAICRNDL